MPAPSEVTVGDAIDFLQTLDRSLPLIAQEDSEGNGFSPVYRITTGLYNRKWRERYEESEAEDYPEAVLAAFIEPSH